MTHRVIQLHGDDTASFLQGLITQDIHFWEKQPALYTAFLTPQGRMLADAILVKKGNIMAMDVHETFVEPLLHHMTKYRLRKKVTWEVMDPDVMGVWSIKTPLTSVDSYYKDPRTASLGWRVMAAPSQVSGDNILTSEEEEAQRILVGVPGQQDWDSERATPLAVGMHDLGAISWDKGCYMGQELTARTHHRGVVRKRLFPVSFHPSAPPYKTEIFSQGEGVGHVRSTWENRGLAWMRVDAALKQEPCTLCGHDGTVTPHIPAWMNLQAEKSHDSTACS